MEMVYLFLIPFSYLASGMKGYLVSKEDGAFWCSNCSL